MKTLLTSFLAFFLLLTTAIQAQQQTAVSESTNLAKADNGIHRVQLSWKKEAENTDYYVVERSTDGKSFNQIALVFTAEDPTFRNYQFKDKMTAPAGSNVYYRIALVSTAKKVTYLPVQQANLSNGSMVTLGFSNALASRN